MGKSLRERRWEEIDKRYGEIDRLLVRYADMPPGRARETVSIEVEKRFDEIDKLNEPTYLEKASGQHVAMGLSVACVLAGILLSTYGLVTLGLVVALLSLRTLARSPERSEENVRRWQP